MSQTIPARIVIRRDTAANWTTQNPVLLQGEWGFETDARKLKIGDGATTWTALSYYSTGSGGSGTVTSVGLSLPGLFSVSGSPVTAAGTLTATLATQSANLLWAGPTTGVAAAPTFRSLVAADLPATTVTAGSYTYGSFTVDAAGRLTAASSGTAPISAVLTGYVSGAGTIAATDSILTAIQKLNGNGGTKANTGAIGSSGLTMTTARLLGRTTAATGAPEEITVGGGLSLSAGALALASTAVTAGSYTYGSFTVDAAGRLTAASNGTAPVTSVTGTAPIVSSGGATPAISLSAATISAAGSMSAADKSKLDGIAAGATANSSDATLLARANHTGTQAGSTVTGAYTAAGMTMATARILGRSTAATGAVEEITIGTGLSLSAGTLTATGGSGGSGTRTFARFTPRDNQPPATNFATIDTRNSVMVLEFDAATEESSTFVGVIPEAANLASGLIVKIWWMADTATSGTVQWAASFEDTGSDLDADSFDTAAEATSTANATSGIETVAQITITTIDGITAGDRFRLRINRKAADATNDLMTGDAQLVAVEVRGVA